MLTVTLTSFGTYLTWPRTYSR